MLSLCKPTLVSLIGISQCMAHLAGCLEFMTFMLWEIHL